MSVAAAGASAILGKCLNVLFPNFSHYFVYSLAASALDQVLLDFVFQEEYNAEA